MTKNKGGRPTSYTKRIAAKLCSQISTGMSLRKVCKSKKMPSTASVYIWFSKHPEFIEQYARAKVDSADADQDRLDEIAEGTLEGRYDPKAARVAADIIKWSASKKKPKKYGDRTTLSHEGSISYTDLTEEELDRKIQQLERANEQSTKN